VGQKFEKSSSYSRGAQEFLPSPKHVDVVCVLQVLLFSGCKDNFFLRGGGVNLPERQSDHKPYLMPGQVIHKKMRCEKKNFKKTVQIEPDPGTIPTCGVIKAIFSVLP